MKIYSIQISRYSGRRHIFKHITCSNQ